MPGDLPPTGIRDRFGALLAAGSAELYADNPMLMRSPDLLTTRNVIDEEDLELFFAGVDAGVIRLARGAKFNTFDRPRPGGRWSLLSRSKEGGWYNAEYLPQLAAYADAVLRLGYPKDRVLFELPPQALQLDLAILDDRGDVVVVGEAKRDVGMLSKLVEAVTQRFGGAAPDDSSKKRGDEARQLAWRLWTIRPSLCWLIAPGTRQAYQCQYAPLRMEPIGALPDAASLHLSHRPPRPLAMPRFM
jgi:hypothetical protein